MLPRFSHATSVSLYFFFLIPFSSNTLWLFVRYAGYVGSNRTFMHHTSSMVGASLRKLFENCSVSDWDRFVQQFFQSPAFVKGQQDDSGVCTIRKDPPFSFNELIAILEGIRADRQSWVAPASSQASPYNLQNIPRSPCQQGNNPLSLFLLLLLLINYFVVHERPSGEKDTRQLHSLFGGRRRRCQYSAAAVCHLHPRATLRVSQLKQEKQNKKNPDETNIIPWYEYRDGCGSLKERTEVKVWPEVLFMVTTSDASFLQAAKLGLTFPGIKR